MTALFFFKAGKKAVFCCFLFFGAFLTNGAVAQDAQGARDISRQGRKTGASLKATENAWPYPYGIFGDLNGARDQLFENGFTIQGRHVAEGAGNVRGGARKMATYAGETSVSLHVDFDKLLGWQGGSFDVSIIGRNGRNLTGEAGINALMQVQEIWGRQNVARMPRFAFTQSFFDDRMSIRIGKLEPAWDFASVPCDAMNLTFCSSFPGNMDIDYWYNWPIGQLGARFNVNIVDDRLYFRIGAYQQSTNNLKASYGFALGSASGATGALIPLEIGGKTHFVDGRLQGNWGAGIWYDTSRTKDVALDKNGRPQSLTGLDFMRHSGHSGVYFFLLQQLTHPVDAPDPLGGLRLFADIGISDRETSKTERQMALGFTYRGLFADRPHEDFMVAFGATHASDRKAAADASIGIPADKRRYGEFLIESYYGVNVVPGWVVRPDAQFIFRPNGQSAARTAITLGVKSVVDF